LGQFFTPRAIVDFVVELLEPKENELICDPCAGSGGFLIKSFESVKERIEKRYIELKKSKQKEIFGKELENIDDEVLQVEYEKFLEETNLEEQKELEKLSHSSIFRTDANPRMARVSKMNMIMHGDGHNRIHHNDGLLNVNGIFRDRFNLIVTNPPFGTNLNSNSTITKDDKYSNEEMISKYLKEYGERYSEEMKQVTENFGKPIRSLFEVGATTGQTEVLFIERSLDLLKAGGRMGIVLPEGVFNSSNLEEVRTIFESRAKILLIVSLPQEIFISSGATVKTSLLFLKKFTESEKEKYERIVSSVTSEIEGRFREELENIDKKLKKRGKEALSKEEKKELREKRSSIEEEIKKEVKHLLVLKLA
jgi:type I restriction enzyme M protein